MTIITKREIIIPAGTKLDRGPTRTDYATPHYEEIVAFGPDHVATFTIDIDAIREHPDTFEIED